jgi:hypothetical protein
LSSAFPVAISLSLALPYRKSRYQIIFRRCVSPLVIPKFDRNSVSFEVEPQVRASVYLQGLMRSAKGSLCKHP